MHLRLLRIYEGRAWIYADQTGHEWTLLFPLVPAHQALAIAEPNYGRGI